MEYSQERSPQKLVFFLRHGDRADKSQEFFEKKIMEKQHDSHLTSLGKFQAQEAGKKIDSIIQNNFPQIKKLKIVSSPFLRCLMTCENLTRGSNLEVINNEILVENSICELQLNINFDNCPHEQGLMLREQKIDKVDYITNLKINDENMLNNIPQFPEGFQDEDCYDRVYNGYKQITQQYFEQVDNQELQNCALVIVTHGGVVAGILSKLGIYDENIGFQMTNINGLLYQNRLQEQFEQMSKIICKQESNHLERAQKLYNKYLQQQNMQ